MKLKTDYQGIHERAYQVLRKKGDAAWSDAADLDYRIEHFAKVLGEFGPDGWAKVLVLGSGDGEVSVGLSKRGFRITGVDISTTAIAWAREKATSANEEVRFVEGNVLDLSFLDETFPAVIDDHCFHCIIGEDRPEEILKEIEAAGFEVLRFDIGIQPEGWRMLEALARKP